MYLIKQHPEDFIVEEILDLPLGEGPYTYYKLTKRNLTTVEAVQRIARIFHVLPKFINFAGTKDKNAITTQYLSIHHGPEKNLEENNFSLEFLGKGAERLNLGTLKGNHFKIIVRETNASQQRNWFINYFDDQRFGSNADNHHLGKLLLQRKFADVCSHLQVQVAKNDYLGALRKMPKKIFQMYMHAYQSYLWNELVKSYFQCNKIPFNSLQYSLGELYIPQDKPVQCTVPLIGFGTEASQFRVFVDDVLKHEGITERDFIMRELPELAVEGDMRDLVVEVSDLMVDYDISQRVCFLSFTLLKGAYATMFLKHIFQ